MKVLSILALASLLVISGCVSASMSVGDLSKVIDNFVGRSVTVNGQLGISCMNAAYTNDCILEVCDSQGGYCLNMNVDSNPQIKEMLRGYYNGPKVNVSVTGYLAKAECPSNDSTCSPRYYIQVIDVKVIK
jgi:hypothetical protein